MNSEQFSKLQAQARAAGWEAKENPISSLPFLQQKMRLGCVPPHGDRVIFELLLRQGWLEISR